MIFLIRSIDIQEVRYVTDKIGNRKKETVTVATVWRISGSFPWKNGTASLHSLTKKCYFKSATGQTLPQATWYCSKA